jgi:hypothetical protein
VKQSVSEPEKGVTELEKVICLSQNLMNTRREVV